MRNPTKATSALLACLLAGSLTAAYAVEDSKNDSQQTVPEKLLYKPGTELSVTTDTEDIVPTWDLDLARRQVAAYPDSPEAAFILAVALTRTSKVEEALKEVQRARRLAESKGGPNYFDKMIDTYEKSLVAYPNNNEARYGLAWAYYMKAYLLARYSRKVAAWKAANPQAAQAATTTPTATTPTSAAATTTAASSNASTGGAGANATAAKVASAQTQTPAVNNKDVVKALTSGSPAAVATLATTAMALANGKAPALDNVPHIPSALEKVEPSDVPQIKRYYELALQKLDDILKTSPDDVWTIVYRAHLKAEYTGNLNEAMSTWKAVEAKHPNNPAPYFFLGEGYLKQGNLKESLNHVSRAIALRALGN